MSCAIKQLILYLASDFPELKGKPLTLRQFVLYFRPRVCQFVVKNEQLTIFAVLSKSVPSKLSSRASVTSIQLTHILRFCIRSEHSRKRQFVGKKMNPCYYYSSGTIHFLRTYSLCHGPSYRCARDVQTQNLTA